MSGMDAAAWRVEGGGMAARGAGATAGGREARALPAPAAAAPATRFGPPTHFGALTHFRAPTRFGGLARFSALTHFRALAPFSAPVVALVLALAAFAFASAPAAAQTTVTLTITASGSNGDRDTSWPGLQVDEGDRVTFRLRTSSAVPAGRVVQVGANASGAGWTVADLRSNTGRSFPSLSSVRNFTVWPGQTVSSDSSDTLTVASPSLPL